MLTTMKEILDRANRENYAVAAPNVFHTMDAQAYIMAAEEMKSPLILDVAGFLANKDLLGNALCRMAERSTVPIAINLDHGTDLKQVMECVQAGFTSVMYDLSALPFEEETEKIREATKLVHSVGVSMEAELGHVGSMEDMGGNSFTIPEEAGRFVEETQVDCLAVSIGTTHGIYPEGMKPEIRFDLLEEIKKATGNLPLVLHGSSGTSDEDIYRACRSGINKVNICGELMKNACEKVQNSDLSGGNAYNLYAVIGEELKNSLKEKIRLYGSEQKSWIVAPKGFFENCRYSHDQL